MPRLARSSACSNCRRSRSVTARAMRPGLRITASRRASRRVPSRRASSLLRARRKNLGQFVSRRDFELVVAALPRRLVRAPAHEHGGMPETIALHVVVLHFANALGPQRLPRQVLAAAPATLPARHAVAIIAGGGPVAPGMVGQGVLAQR